MYKRLITLAAFAIISSMSFAQKVVEPTPSKDQIALQDMEMYAFLHYSLRHLYQSGMGVWQRGRKPLQSVKPRHSPMGAHLQGNRHEGRDIYGKASLRFLYVAIGIHRLFSQIIALERWQGRCGARVSRCMQGVWIKVCGISLAMGQKPS